jgi:hypothetical protein
LISAIKEKGKAKEIVILSEKGRELLIENPFEAFRVRGAKAKGEVDYIKIKAIKDQRIRLSTK